MFGEYSDTLRIKKEMSNQNAPESSTSPDSSQSPGATSGFAYVKCGVPRCFNYFDGQRQEFIGISYFPFPDDPELRKQWIKAIDLPKDTDTGPLKICSQHFGNNDIYDMQEGDGKTTTHLKPNAYPCKKLYAFVQNYSEQESPFDERGRFIGLENPLMDTSRDVSSAKEGGLLTTDEDALPRITSVLSMDANGKMVGSACSVNTNNEESKVLTYPKNRNTKSGQVEDIARHPEELILEETESSDDSQTPVTNPERGLQVIPALVKLPPRLPKIDLVGDSINAEGSASSGPITTSRLPNVDLANEMDISNNEESVTNQLSVGPSTSSIPVTLCSEAIEQVPYKRRRGRRSKEEMRQQEEDDEWEPSFWGRKALKKDGYASHLDADKKRKDNETRTRTTRSKDYAPEPPLTLSNDAGKNQNDGLEEEDEGWRVLEPIATGHREDECEEEPEDDSNNPLALLEVSMAEGESGGNTGVPSAGKRRPGPASKTCRPRYIPQSRDANDDDNPKDEKVERKNSTETNDAAVDKDGDHRNLPTDDSYDPSMLVDWSFFKSLLPDLNKLSHEKRIEMKSFVLDTLNSAIYDGKPITPIMNL